MLVFRDDVPLGLNVRTPYGSASITAHYPNPKKPDTGWLYVRYHNKENRRDAIRGRLPKRFATCIDGAQQHACREMEAIDWIDRDDVEVNNNPEPSSPREELQSIIDGLDDNRIEALLILLRE